MQKQKYKRLENHERESISRGLAQGRPIREVDREIGRSPSTVSREIKRNSGKTGYRAFSASRRARRAATSRRKGKSKIARQSALQQYVTEKLSEEWSPQEISDRYTILVPLGDKEDALNVREAYEEALKTVPNELRKTLTYDQGKEMSQHEKFTIDTGIQVYFTHPGSPWERGTNENTNGLIRQYFSKGTDFTKVTEDQIKIVQRKLNDRPRKALGFNKPDEVYNTVVALKV